ncbi:MAG: glycosyltransferase [Methanobacteriota archaeon]|nr:MAG: glycosyltransferase [Euryarchaeota archaeon]
MLKINIIGAGQEGKKATFGGIELAPKRLMKTLRKKGVEVDYNGKRPLEEYDLVDIHFGFNPRLLSKAMKKTKAVVHVHSVPQDMVGGIFGYSLIDPFMRRYLRYYYNKAPFLIPVSEFAKKCVREIGVTTPATAVSNGIPMDQFKVPTNEDRQSAKERFTVRYGLDPEKPLIGGIGSLFPRKGVRDFKEIAIQRPDYQFIWVGKSQPIYPRFFFNRYLGKVPENMKLIGFVEDIEEFFFGIDILLVTTHMETQGLPPLEAAATKTPLVVRDIEVFDWLVNDVNCYRAGDILGFVTSLDYLLTNEKERTRLVEQAFKDVQQHDIDRTTDIHIGIYEKIINDGYPEDGWMPKI